MFGHLARGAEGGLLLLSLEARIEGAAHQGGHGFRPDAIEQAVERRPGGEGGQEALVVADLVADVGQVRRCEVEELATPESFRIDPVGHVPERPRLATKLLRETVRVRLRASDVVALDRDDELIEARAIVRDLLVTLDVWPVLWEEVAS